MFDKIEFRHSQDIIEIHLPHKVHFKLSIEDLRAYIPVVDYFMSFFVPIYFFAPEQSMICILNGNFMLELVHNKLVHNKLSLIRILK